jgi:hypothetical protein
MEGEDNDYFDQNADSDNESDNKNVFQEEAYNPGPQEDSARRRIAYILLGLLSVVLIWALVSITLRPESDEHIVKVLEIVLGPIIALVSAATGFYFGSKQTR